MMQAIIERNRGAEYLPPWRADGVEFVKRSWSAAEIGALFESDVANRRFVRLARDFSAKQVNCLRHLARTGACTAAPAEAGREPMAIN